MKYLIEVLGTNAAPYPKREQAVRALDLYGKHRKGQPVIAIYVGDDSKRKALLAIGTDDSDNNKYDIIGDVKSTTSISSSVSASDVKLNEIIFENLLDDYNQIYGEHRFGYLGVTGTLSDTWHSQYQKWLIPSGTSVQEAFEAILIGQTQSDPDSAAITLIVYPEKITLPNNSSTLQYTVNLNKTGARLQTIALMKDGVQLNENLSSLKNIGTQSVSLGYTVLDSEVPLPGESRTLTFTVTATDIDGNPVTVTPDTLVIEYQEQDVQNTSYTLRYHTAVSNQTYSEMVTGSIYTLESEGTLPVVYNPPIKDTFGWDWPNDLKFLGWSLSATNPSVVNITASSYIPVGGNIYNQSCDVYGVWHVISESDLNYTVTYMPNGAQGEPVEQSTVNTIPALINEPANWTAPNGKQFAGWATSSESSSTISSITSSMFGGESPNYTLTLYAVWEDIPAEPKPDHLEVTVANKTLAYNGTQQSYDPDSDPANNITVKLVYDDGHKETLNSSQYNAVSDPVSGTNAGTYHSDDPSINVGLTVTYNPGDGMEPIVQSAPAYTLTITKLNANIAAKIDGQSSKTMTTGSSAPATTYVPTGFLQSDTPTNLNGSWSPALNMNAAGTYTLSPVQIGSPYTTNYNITYTNATLTLQEPPLTAQFTTRYGNITDDVLMTPSLLSSSSFSNRASSYGFVSAMVSSGALDSLPANARFLLSDIDPEETPCETVITASRPASFGPSVYTYNTISNKWTQDSGYNIQSVSNTAVKIDMGENGQSCIIAITIA